MPRFLGFAALIALAELSPACHPVAPATPPTVQRSEPPTRSEPPVDPAVVALRDSGWGKLELARIALELSVPEAQSWREVAGKHWVELEHAPSHSRLELTVKRAARLVRPEECEAEARLEHPDLPRVEAESAIERRSLTLPGDLRGELSVSLEDVGDTLVGHATLFGASVGRCVAMHFVTRVRGAGRDHEVARRLRLVVDGVLPTLSVRTADARIQPQPLER
jgi:hypothetical protein